VQIMEQKIYLSILPHGIPTRRMRLYTDEHLS
jgi:hypothetical protein